MADMKTAVVELLRAQAADVADAFARDLHATHPLYRDADPSLATRSRDSAYGSIIAFVSWVERGTGSLDPIEIAYLQQLAADSAAQLFPLEALVEPVRMGVQLLWNWLVRACDDAESGQAIVVGVLEDLVQFQVELQRVLTDAYVQARFQPDAEEREVQYELIELLLAARPVNREVRARLMTDYGLGGGDRCAVLVATNVARPDPAAIRRATAIARQRPASERWLVADRVDDVVAVIPVRGGVDSVIDDVGVWLHHLRRVHGVDLRAGLSTPGDLTEVSDRYVEAKEALRLGDDDPERLGALSRVRLFDYLTSRIDPTARRLVPPELQRLRLEDERAGGTLRETLSALADNDLNVRRAAEALFVHPNTVHYRIRRIAQLTGYDPRRFAHLVDLLAALRVFDVDAVATE